MSRSYHKSNTMHHAFMNWVCYFSNKKDKVITNKLFRRVNKHRLREALQFVDFDSYNPLNKTKEINDVWNFASDGLRKCFIFKHYPWFKYSEEAIKKEMRK